MYGIVVTPHAVRDLKNLSRDVVVRVDLAIQKLKENPHMPGVKYLRDFRLADWRVRVGDYRILFDIDEAKKVVIILRVRHRKDAYR